MKCQSIHTTTVSYNNHTHMKHLSLILMSLLIFSCKSDLESIQGHWHDVTFPDSEKYMTLDIKDSSIYINKYDKSGWYGHGKIKQVDRDLIAEVGPYGEHYLSSKIIIESDTLILVEHLDTLEERATASLWIRHENDSEDMRKDISSNLMVNIALLIDNKSIPFDSVGLNNKWCMVNIGYPRFKSSVFPEYDKDTLVMNMYDAIGRFSDIPEFVEAENESEWVEPDFPANDSLVFIINADSSIPDFYFDSIYFYLEQHPLVSSVYRTCINEEFNGMGLQKLQ